MIQPAVRQLSDDPRFHFQSEEVGDMPYSLYACAYHIPHMFSLHRQHTMCLPLPIISSFDQRPVHSDDN
jgi:hypothetical protein